MPTPAELRLLADQLEVIQELEDASRAAKAAYAADRDNPELRTAHRAASQALADAREAARQANVTAVTTEPGSVTIIPNAVPATKN